MMKKGQMEIIGEKTLIYTYVSGIEEVLSYTDEDAVSDKVYYYWIQVDNYPLGIPYGVETL